MAALDQVEDEGTAPDHGAGRPDLGEEADAMPEGPLPDGDDLPDEEDGGFSLFDWATNVPEGSHTNFDSSDWWDPENGAENRLAYHLSDAAGEGAGYPNGLGVLVSLAELWWSAAESSTSSTSSDGSDDPPETETVARSEAEELV